MALEGEFYAEQSSFDSGSTTSSTKKAKALEGEFYAEQSSFDSGSTASSTKKVKGKYASKQTYLNFPNHQLGSFTQDVGAPPRPILNSKRIADDPKKRESAKKKKKDVSGQLHDPRLGTPIATESTAKSNAIVTVEKGIKPDSRTKKPISQGVEVVETKTKKLIPDDAEIIELDDDDDDDDEVTISEVKKEKKPSSKKEKKPSSKKSKKKSSSNKRRRDRPETTRIKSNDMVYAEYELRMMEEEFDDWVWVEEADYHDENLIGMKRFERISERNTISPQKDAIHRSKSHKSKKSGEIKYDEKRWKRMETKANSKSSPLKKVSFPPDSQLCKTARHLSRGKIMEPIHDINSVSHPFVKKYIHLSRSMRRITWMRLMKPEITWPIMKDNPKVAPEDDENDDDPRGFLTMLEHENFNKIQLVFKERRLGSDGKVKVGVYTYLALEAKARKDLF